MHPDDPLDLRERKPPPAGFHAQCLAAAGFGFMAALAWWNSRTAPDFDAQVAAGLRQLLLPCLLAAVCAAVNAAALRRGRSLTLLLRASPLLVFLAAMATQRLLG